MDGLLFSSIQCHMNPPACKRASTRHNIFREHQCLITGFVSWEPAFKHLYCLVLQPVPGCHLHDLSKGVFTLTQMFAFPKGHHALKLKFTCKSCSSVLSVQVLVVEVAYL